MQIKIVCFEKAVLVRVIAPQLTNKTHKYLRWELKTKLINNCLHITMTLSPVKYYYIKNKLKTDKKKQ